MDEFEQRTGISDAMQVKLLEIAARQQQPDFDGFSVDLLYRQYWQLLDAMMTLKRDFLQEDYQKKAPVVATDTEPQPVLVP